MKTEIDIQECYPEWMILRDELSMPSDKDLCRYLLNMYYGKTSMYSFSSLKPQTQMILEQTKDCEEELASDSVVFQDDKAAVNIDTTLEDPGSIVVKDEEVENSTSEMCMISVNNFDDVMYSSVSDSNHIDQDNHAENTSKDDLGEEIRASKNSDPIVEETRSPKKRKYTKRNRSFTIKFKSDAVKWHQNNGQSITKTAKHFNVSKSHICQWINLQDSLEKSSMGKQANRKRLGKRNLTSELRADVPIKNEYRENSATEMCIIKLENFDAMTCSTNDISQDIPIESPNINLNMGKRKRSSSHNFDPDHEGEKYSTDNEESLMFQDDFPKSSKQRSGESDNSNWSSSENKKRIASTKQKVNQNANLECYLCEFETLNSKDMKSHMKNKHGGTNQIDNVKKKYLCQECGFQTKSNKIYSEHCTLYHNEGGVKPEPKEICEYCNKAFIFRSALTAHIRMVHRETNICKYCGENFNRLIRLHRHLKVEHNIAREKRFHCTVCTKKFDASEKLNRHFNSVHLKKKDFICTWKGCEKSFATTWSLKVHERIHNDEKPVVCSLCGSSFRQHGSLVYHMKHKHETVN